MTRSPYMCRRRSAAVGVFMLVLFAASAEIRAEPVRTRSTGQTVYVPVWPNVFFGPRVSELPLAATLQVHNVDPEGLIELVAVDYYRSDGTKLRSLLSADAPHELKPFAAHSYHLKESELTGQPGANFLVKWRAVAPANVPIIDAVMIGVAHGQGISFISHGQPISEP